MARKKYDVESLRDGCPAADAEAGSRGCLSARSGETNDGGANAYAYGKGRGDAPDAGVSDGSTRTLLK